MSEREKLKGNPRFIEGEGSLKLKREPLTVKEEPTIGQNQFLRFSQMHEGSIFREKPSWLHDKQGITTVKEFYRG